MSDGNLNRSEMEGANGVRPRRRKDGSFDVDYVKVNLGVEDEFGPLFKARQKTEKIDPEFADLMIEVIARLKACRVANDLHEDPIVLAVQLMDAAFEELQKEPLDDAKLFDAVSRIVRENWPIGFKLLAAEDLILIHNVVRAIKKGEDVLVVLEHWENSFP